ncbi:MAG: TolC family protein [Dissulfuribacterales bacterium]
MNRLHLGPVILFLFFCIPGHCFPENIEQAWQTAMQSNHSLMATYQDINAASYSLKAARAARLPNLNLGSDYTIREYKQSLIINSQDMPPDLIGAQLPLMENKSLSYQAVMELPIYTGGMITNGINATKSSLKAARNNQASMVQNLKMKVAEAYVSVLRSFSDVAVAESHVKNLFSHAEDVENKFTQGFVAANDLLAAKVSLADARQHELQAMNRLDIAKAGYNRLLVRPLEQKVELDDLKSDRPAESLADLTVKALQQRSELKSIDKQIEALRHKAAMERASCRPYIGISGGYNFNENEYHVEEGAWSAMFGVKWKIFDGGIARNRSSALKCKAAALLEHYAELKTIIALQVRKVWLDVEESRERANVTEAALSQAEENLRVAKDRYQEGLSTNTEVLDAETLRTKSHSNYDNAVYDFVLATLRLKRAVGNL